MNMDGEPTLAERALASLEGKTTPKPRTGGGQNIGLFLREYSQETRGEIPVNIGPHIEQWFSLTTRLNEPAKYSRCDELNINFADLPFCL